MSNSAVSMKINGQQLPIDLIAFDADDTLWDCQGHFDEVERQYCEVLSPYASADEVSASLFKTESKNMPLLGYGSKAFTISLVENAIALSAGRVTNSEISAIINLGKSLLQLPATPLEGVAETLKAIHENVGIPMVVFTKGDNLDQQNKFHRSGLGRWFDDIIVVADKTPKEYQRLCRFFDTRIDRLCMVGNSFKSDILPVLQLGGYAVHIPYPLMWAHEAADVVDHPHLVSIKAFKELNSLIGPFPKHPV